MNTISGTGRWRVYFNRHKTGRPWCVAPVDGSWELEVVKPFVDGFIEHHYDENVPRTADHLGPPTGWYEVDGYLVVTPDGIATITRVVSNS